MTLIEKLIVLLLLTTLSAWVGCMAASAYWDVECIRLRNVQRNQDIGYEADHNQSPFGKHAPWYQPSDPVFAVP